MFYQGPDSQYSRLFQYRHEWAWLCSNKALFTKNRQWTRFGLGPQFADPCSKPRQNGPHDLQNAWTCRAVPQGWSHRITGLTCVAPVNTGPMTESPVCTQFWGGTGRGSMGPSSGTSPLSCLLRGKCQRPGLSGPRIVPGVSGPGMAQKVLSESPRIGRTQTLFLREKQSCRGVSME